MPAAGRRRALTLGVAAGCLAAGLGAVLGSGPLSDNSFLTHLATGRLIWDGDLPRSDPYTFTAAGDGWVVQSWFASVIYGGLEDLGGLGLIRLLVAASTALLAAITWALTRSAETIGSRLLVFAPALLAGAGSWSERPLLFGLIGMGAVLLALEGRLDARWLVPIAWIWVNTHGTWPLGLVAVACVAIGRRLDGDPLTTEVPVLRWLVAGIGLSLLNPYGWKLLAFPVRLLSRRDSLDLIVEWGPLQYEEAGDWAFLALVMLAMVAIRRRPSWLATVPAVVFATAALTGARNVPIAALTLIPGAARGIAGLGTISSGAASRAGRMLVAGGAALVAVSVFGVVGGGDVDDEPFPVEANAWLVQHDLSPATHRVLAREYVGNWFEVVYGPTQTVFVDDRVEVVPEEVLADHQALLNGDPDWDQILRRYEPDAVLWSVDAPLAALLEVSPDWSIRYRDTDWMVALPADR